MIAVETNTMQESGVTGVGNDENRQPSPTSSSGSGHEVRKEIVKMQLAPIPASSPWKKLEVKAGDFSGQDEKWPSAHVAATKLADDKCSSKTKQQPIIITGKEKWVPIKPSLLAGNSNGPRRTQRKKKPTFNAFGGGNTASSRKKNGNKIMQAQSRKPSDGQRKQMTSEKKSENSSTEEQDNDSTESALAHEEQHDMQEEMIQPEDEQKFLHEPPQQQHYVAGQLQSQHQPIRRYQSRQSHVRDSHKNFIPRQFQGNNVQHNRRNYIHRNVNGSYRPRGFTPQFDPMSAINDIARQIEYYFSPENLQKDTYLRSQLNSKGWISFATIASFYRLIKLSWGGDVNLIMGALREIVANETATVEVAHVSALDTAASPEEKNLFHNYAVRAKEWEDWVLEEPKSYEANFDILKGDQMDEFRFVSVPLPIHPAAIPVASQQSSIDASLDTSSNPSDSQLDESLDFN